MQLAHASSPWLPARPRRANRLPQCPTAAAPLATPAAAGSNAVSMLQARDEENRMSKPASKGSRSGAIQRVREYIDKGEFETELARRVAIRTESQKLPDPAALAECRRYLDDEM